MPTKTTKKPSSVKVLGSTRARITVEEELYDHEGRIQSLEGAHEKRSAWQVAFLKAELGKRSALERRYQDVTKYLDECLALWDQDLENTRAIVRRVETLEAAQLDREGERFNLAEAVSRMPDLDQCGDGFSGGRPLRPGLWTRAWSYLRPGQ